MVQAAQPSHTGPALAEYMRKLHIRANARTRIRTTSNKSRHTFHADFLPPPFYSRLLIILAPLQRFFLSPSLFSTFSSSSFFSFAHLLCALAILIVPSYVHTYLMLFFAIYNSFIQFIVRNAHHIEEQMCLLIIVYKYLYVYTPFWKYIAKLNIENQYIRLFFKNVLILCIHSAELKY